MRGRPAIGKSGFGQLSERGRKRVPLEGPPTRMTAFDSDIQLQKEIKEEKIMEIII
jgi:hypothetical protein